MLAAAICLANIEKDNLHLIWLHHILCETGSKNKNFKRQRLWSYFYQGTDKDGKYFPNVNKYRGLTGGAARAPKPDKTPVTRPGATADATVFYLAKSR